MNGREAGHHTGGYVSFCFDITDYVKDGENVLTLSVRDDLRDGRQCRGKHSGVFYSVGCDYTRTTGIWQTVWLEFVPEAYMKKVYYYPNIGEGTITIRALTEGEGVLTAEAFYEGVSCGRAETKVCAGNGILTIALSRLHLWEPGQGRLYDLKLSFGEDRVDSYFGMREIRIQGEKKGCLITIQGKPAEIACIRQDFSDHDGIRRDVWLLQWEVYLPGESGTGSACFSVKAL